MDSKPIIDYFINEENKSAELSNQQITQIQKPQNIFFRLFSGFSKKIIITIGFILIFSISIGAYYLEKQSNNHANKLHPITPTIKFILKPTIQPNLSIQECFEYNKNGNTITSCPICGNGICEVCEDGNNCCNYPCQIDQISGKQLCPPPACLGYCEKDCKIINTPTLSKENIINSNISPQIDYSCHTNADCVIKNIGSCCGEYLACVNINSKPNIDYVKKKCEDMGVDSTCGFPSIDGCNCVDNICKSIVQEEKPL